MSVHLISQEHSGEKQIGGVTDFIVSNPWSAIALTVAVVAVYMQMRGTRQLIRVLERRRK